MFGFETLNAFVIQIRGLREFLLREMALGSKLPNAIGKLFADVLRHARQYGEETASLTPHRCPIILEGHLIAHRDRLQAGQSTREEPMAESQNLSPDLKKCSHCAKAIKSEANFCPYCGTQQPMRILKGSNGEVELFSDKVILTRSGFRAKMFFGFTNPKGDKTIYFNHIAAIQVKKPSLTCGYIKFTVPGDIEGYGGAFDALKNENAVTFSAEKEYEIALDIKTKIENTKTPTVTGTKSLSDADEIRKFKQLLDEGVLSNEEFERKKKQLLG